MPSPSLPDRKVLYYSVPRQLGKHHWAGKPEGLLLIFIAAVWRVLVSENTKRQQWTRISDWESQAMDFLRQLVFELYGESEFGWRHQSTVNPRDVDRTMDRVVKQIQGFKTWRYLRKEFAESAAKKARKKRQPKPAATGPALSYDEKHEVLIACGVPYEKVDMRQYKMIKVLYDVKKEGNDKGLSGKAWLERAGYAASRIENIFWSPEGRALKEELAPCGSDRLYRFTCPDQGPRPK